MCRRTPPSHGGSVTNAHTTARETRQQYFALTFMTESIDTPSLFSESELQGKAPRPKKTTAAAKKAAPKNGTRVSKLKKIVADEISIPAPEAPVEAPIAAPIETPSEPAPKKRAARSVKSKAKKVADETPVETPVAPPAESPMEAPVAAPVQAPEPVRVQERVETAPTAEESKPARSSKVAARKSPPARPGRSARPKPVEPVFQRGEVEEWRPGAGKRTDEPAPRPVIPAVRPVAPAPPVRPASPVAPVERPSIPATHEQDAREGTQPPAQPAPSQPARGPVGKPWEEQTREERIAAALQQFNAGRADQFAGRPPQELPAAVRPDLPVTERPVPGGRFERHERRERPEFGRPPRHERGERPERHERRERPERPERYERPDRPDSGSGAAPLPEGPAPEPVFAEGIVEVSGKGFGFVRDPKRGFAQHPSDVFVTPEVCRRYTLRDGMWIKGEVRRGNRGPQLHRLTEVEGEDPEKVRTIPMFEELTTINPNKWLKLETVPDRFTTRVVDLVAPIGKGQRGIIVAPPRTGKTTYLEHIADAIGKNHPEMKLIILLVDERPEEVTEIKRSVPFAEIMASSNDQDIKSHTRIALLAIERARRLVEMGKDVFVLLDSITRVGRAFNNAMSGGGRTMSGGVDARALEIPRKLFASARNTEEAGSLTIIATALIETGSKMDDLIFQEFKGTGNMELVLDRKISDLRVYPAVDIFQSGTRRDELLLTEADLHKINIIRRGLAGHRPAEAIERLLFFLNKFPTNAQMLREIPG